MTLILAFLSFVQGANSYGQLGSGHREDTILPSQSKLPSSLAKRLKQITGGGGHTAVLTGLTIHNVYK